MQVPRKEVIEGHCVYDTASPKLITLTINMC